MRFNAREVSGYHLNAPGTPLNTSRSTPSNGTQNRYMPVWWAACCVTTLSPCGMCYITIYHYSYCFGAWMNTYLGESSRFCRPQSPSQEVGQPTPTTRVYDCSNAPCLVWVVLTYHMYHVKGLQGQYWRETPCLVIESDTLSNIWTEAGWGWLCEHELPYWSTPTGFHSTYYLNQYYGQLFTASGGCQTYLATCCGPPQQVTSPPKMGTIGTHQRSCFEQL